MVKKTNKTAAVTTAAAAVLTTTVLAALSTEQVTTLEQADLAALKPSEDAAPAKAKNGALPDQVTLASLYGFYDEAGHFHGWGEGQVVTDPDHIAVLIERGAPLAVAKE
jgi:hypothetical protein